MAGGGWCFELLALSLSGCIVRCQLPVVGILAIGLWQYHTEGGFLIAI
jgi:hypothetical protein